MAMATRSEGLRRADGAAGGTGGHDGYGARIGELVERQAPGAGLPGAIGEALREDVGAVLRGALGGLVGTVAMSAIMLMTHQTGRMGRLPPERITQKLLFRGRRRRHKRAKNQLSVLFHFGFGGVGGAMYGWLHRRVPPAISPVLSGTLFGCLVWLVSYQGWVPALGLMPAAHDDRSDRQISMFLGHVIYGATLGAVVGALARFARK